VSDTIFALATAPGRAGVAVLRISGPGAGPALEQLGGEALPAARYAARRRLTDKGEMLDDALALWFPAPNSYTGEDVCELHLHGGSAVIEGVLSALGRLGGFRAAAPGEFTRRAFENGKLDLTAAEGLADLVDAETEGQRRQALRQMQGGLSDLYEIWRGWLIEALALYEAEIDFPDEDLPEAIAQRAAPLLEALEAEMTAHLADGHRGERVREGYRIAIIGPPNAGKSSLLNALAQREAAIVSDIPGTTRDIVEARLVMGGYPVWLADTAGLRNARDTIEAEGVRRALARAEQSDLRIAVLDISASDLSVDAFAPLAPSDLLVLAKSDLKAGPAADPARAIAAQRGIECKTVSTVSGAGLEQLRALIAARVGNALSQEETPALTRARHRKLIEQAREAIVRARTQPAAELASEDLRIASRALGQITGRVDVETVLDAIFAEFCIGK
jgi:tRNA modification GTPase